MPTSTNLARLPIQKEGDGTVTVALEAQYISRRQQVQYQIEVHFLNRELKLEL